jgi:predicted nucleotidyltransferase
VAAFAQATLTPVERRMLGRIVELLAQDAQLDLRAVWLYGSRARGEAPKRESDVDVLVVTEGGKQRDTERVDRIVDRVAAEEATSPFHFSVRVRDPGWLRQRRQIGSFFIQEVDRDKIVLYGEE